MSKILQWKSCFLIVQNLRLTESSKINTVKNCTKLHEHYPPAQLGHANGLPKTCKAYANSPAFRPIIDSTSTPYYSIGKLLSSLLQPLAHNDYNLKDSFDVINRIISIHPELYDENYQFVSFDI